VIDHVSLGTTRYAESVAFYRRVLAPLGFELLSHGDAEAAFGLRPHWSFVLYPQAADDTVVGRGMHLAFGAPSRVHVAAVHEAAIAASAQDLWSPRARPDISTTYFGAMFLDLDGHRIEVLTNAQ
jgi:catechol 2,3-dioxygenase-like lactoylglutathione lyase family enzyme